MSDRIANIINKLENAGKSEKSSFVVPYSNLAWAVLKVLERNNFISGVSKKGKKGYTIEAEVIKEEDGQPKISGTKRVSKSSKRVYFGVKDLRPIKNGFGKLIMSTPVGILTGEEARKQKVGGEPLFIIW